MTNPRFLIAKYVPDLSRMEPRNIGLLLWHKGRLLSRFLSPSDARFIADHDTYVQWVTFWNDLISGDVIDVPGRESIPTKSERCIDAILASQEGNYLLVDAGFVPSKLSVRDMPKAVDYLFTQLVATADKPQQDDGDTRAPTLIAQCDSLFDELGIRGSDEFKKDKPVECPVFGVKRHLHCNYFIGNGHPRAILQRARVSNEQSVNSSALTIRALTEAAVIPASHCRFLVKTRDATGDAAAEGLSFLRNLCDVIDVDDHSALDQLASLVLVNADAAL